MSSQHLQVIRVLAGPVVVTVVLCAGLGLAAGASWGFGLAAMLSFGALFRQFYYRQQLINWLRTPLDSEVPEVGTGGWADIFLALHRRSRIRKAQQTSLSLALERFREMSMALPDGVMSLGEDLVIEWMNRQARAHFNLSESADTGQPIVNLVRNPELAEVLTREGQDEPLLLHPRRGAIRTLQVQSVRYGEGRRLLVSRDVTQLEKLETMRRDFVANVSHELKTPLTVVSGFAETLIDGLETLPREDVTRYIGMIHDQSVRMRTLIEDLLTLSALETGESQAAKNIVAIGPLLAQVISDARSLSADRHEITLKMEGPETLLGEEKELRSAITNLVGNAVRYTPAGGHVWVDWVFGPQGQGCLHVKDDGIGIAEQHLPRITERFYRVDRGRSREVGGTGLGLAIVKHVLSRHGAELGVKSELGMGTTFKSCFPAERVGLEPIPVGLLRAK